MIKTVLFALGALLVLAVGYVGWVVIQAMMLANEAVIAEATVAEAEIKVVSRLAGSDRSYKIRSIEFPREWGERLGVRPPEGYAEEPYTLEDTSDPTDPESAAWVKATNAETIRWVGSRPLTPDNPVTLVFPIAEQVPGAGRILFLYEGRLGFGENISAFSVPLEIEDDQADSSG